MLNIKLLGQYDVQLEGQKVDLPSRPVQLLLAYLLLNSGKAHRREHLAGLLWPDSLEATARKNLRNAAWRLRQAIGEEYIIADRATVAFNDTAPFLLDVAVLADEKAIKDTEALIQAVSTYKGELLPGFYEDWVQLERERQRAIFERRLGQLLDSLTAAGHWTESISWAERWIALGYVPEPAYRALMSAHAALGDLAAMATAYRRCVQALESELGVQPSAETTALFEQLSSGHGPAEARPEPVSSLPRHNLPSPSTPFVHRGKEVDELCQLLAGAPANRLITLIGPGGIGKTRLAIEAAGSVVDAFSQGVYYVSLAPVDTSEYIVPSLAESLDFHFYGSEEPRQQLINYLATRNMLLLLDNFEHLLDGAGLLSDMLGAAPALKILVTSRERLHLTHEMVYTLGSMAYPDWDGTSTAPTAAEIAGYDAVKLLLLRARLARPGLEPEEDDLRQMARICRLVQGMPLAIILAAGWLEMLSFEEIGDEISKSLDFLESEMRDLPARQQSVRAAFDYSWQQLGPEEREVFCKLAVFRGGFTRQAAHAITGTGLRALRTLANKSLIATSRPDRYEIHELLRQFAEEKLEAMRDADGTAAAEKTHEAHSTYYLKALAEREADVKGRRQLEALNEIEADLENVRGAWNWAIAREDWTGIKKAMECLHLFFDIRSRFQEGADFFRLARERLSKDESGQYLGPVLARQAILQARFKSADEQIGQDLQRSLTIAHELSNRPEIAFSYLAIGYYNSTVINDFSLGLPFFEKSLEQYKILGDRYFETRALHRIGYCHTNMSNYIFFTRKSLDLAREIGSQDDEALTLSNLGSAQFIEGNYAIAEKYFLQTIALHKELGDREGLVLGHVTAQLGLAYFIKGDMDKARLLAEESLAIAEDIGFINTQAYALALLALQATVTGDHALAERYGHRSRSLPSNPFGVFQAEWALSITYCSLGKYKTARHHLVEALRVPVSFGWPGTMTWLLPVAAVLLAQEGQEKRAVELLALAASHPLSPKGWVEKWGVLEELRAKLTEELDAQSYQAAWQRGQELDLEETAAALLTEFEA